MSSTMERLRQTVEDGNYYEAQQLIKTLYFRFYSQKKTEAAKEILINGAFTMLNAKQTTCGAELIQQLLKLFADLNTTVDSTNIDTINRLAALIPSSDQTKITVLNAALKWSTTNDNYKQGHPDLHAHLAKTYAEIEEYTLAQRHYLKGNSPSELSLMLRAWADQGYPSETDLFITRTVLMYLSMSNLRDAKTVFNAFVSTLSPQQMTPLINFTRLLLLTLEHKTYTVFNLLRQKYATSLNRDPAFNQFLERIAQVFYSVKPANSNAAGGFGGLFNDLFKSFMSNDIELGSEDVD